MTSQFYNLLTFIVEDPLLHAKWLNTLSYMENCGARKIAACEHPTLVKEEMLKHASEEFRHSHYLKKQIKRVTSTHLPDYSLPSLLGGIHTLQYLNRLDLRICRFLFQKRKETLSEVKKMSYLLVTYAIEKRAEHLYPLYETILRKKSSKVYVKSIILEEEEHLREMEEGIYAIKDGAKLAKSVLEMENTFFIQWIESLRKELAIEKKFVSMAI